MDNQNYPIPETEEERNQALDSLAEQLVRKSFPAEQIEQVGLSNLVADYKDELSLNYPSSREMRGR